MGSLIEPIGMGMFAICEGREFGTEGSADLWEIEDFTQQARSPDQISVALFTNDLVDKVVGNSAPQVRIEPYGGARASFTYPKSRDAAWSTEGKSALVFWVRAVNESATGWQGGPFITLHGDGDSQCYLEPRDDLDIMRALGLNSTQAG